MTGETYLSLVEGKRLVCDEMCFQWVVYTWEQCTILFVGSEGQSRGFKSLHFIYHRFIISKVGKLQETYNFSPLQLISLSASLNVWLILFSFQNFSLISYLQNSQTICFPRLTAIYINNYLCTESISFPELSCLYCNLPYKFIKHASCLVCLNF
jgi:hypothetical protein